MSVLHVVMIYLFFFAKFENADCALILYVVSFSAGNLSDQ